MKLRESNPPTALAIALCFDILFVVAVVAIAYMLHSSAHN